MTPTPNGATMIDKNTLDLAREWANDGPIDRRTTAAAAEVIQSLPDAWVDAEKLREVVEQWSTEPLTSETAPVMVEQLRELLPDPVLPTLADMSPDKRVAYQWRMVDTPEGEGVYFTQHANSAAVLYPSGRHTFWKLEEVTPLLDRPGMVWPGRVSRTEPASPRPDGCCGACPEIVGGGVDCTCADNPRCPNHQPRPEDVPVGEPWQVEIDGETAIGYRNDPDNVVWPWQVIFPRGEGVKDGQWSADDDVALIARLVPEPTEQDEEPDFYPVYTDRDGDEWEFIDGRWITGDTHAERMTKREYRVGHASLPAEYGPYTRITKENQHDQ